jgi:hypothetical protein
MKKNHFIYTSLSVALLLGITACHHNDAPVMPAEEVIKDSAKASTVNTLGQLMSNIPSPMDISKELSKEGIQLNKSILNSPDKASSYSSTFQQATNMGIYGADMGYEVSYNQMQDALNYIAQVAKLSGALGITSAYDQKLMDSFKSATSNKDSLGIIIQTAFDRANKELYSNKRASTSTLIFAGGWVEGLYIATNLIKDEKNDKNGPMYQKIWDHVYSFSYLKKVLTDYQSNADCANMLKMLQPVFDFAATLNDKGLSLSDVTNLKNMITDIRNKLV